MIRSTKFFLLHVIFNTLLMFSVSVYLFTSSSDLDTSSDDALVIPQLLGVVPGKIYNGGHNAWYKVTGVSYADTNLYGRHCMPPGNF